MTTPILVLDCHFLCHRAIYTTGHLSYREDRTGVVYAFLRDISTLSELFTPRAWVFCFDSPTSLRQEYFPEYKASRAIRREQLTAEEIAEIAAFRKQLKQLKLDYLPRLGFSNILEYDGLEADDAIAMVCRKYRKRNHLTIVSSDHDLFQCLHTHVEIWNPIRRVMITKESFKEDYRIMPSRWTEVKAIAGCSTDNVPGLPLVGEKTAIKYLRGELSPNLKTYTTIKQGRSVIDRNKKLVTLPFPSNHKSPVLQADHFNPKEWNKLCDELGIRRLQLHGPLKG